VHLARLALTDFRCYETADVTLSPGVTTFTGPNGAGKTNLIEAACYVATFSSRHVRGCLGALRLRRIWSLASVLAVLALVGCEQTSQPVTPSGPSATASGPSSSAIRVGGPRSLLYVLPADGGTPRPLLSAADSARLGDVSNPAWSPDGREIAFSGGCATCTPRLFVVSSTGKNLRQIATGPGGVLSPSWSPTGTAIVFARERGEDQFIVTVSLRTGRVRAINNEPPDADNTDSTPAWSPDGRRIVFARELHHEDVTLWLVPASGGHQPQSLIRRNTANDESHPQWSPDGRSVLFMQTVGAAVTWDLFVINLATGQLSNLTRDSYNEYDPAWSPDGRHIVFASDAGRRFGFRSLYVTASDGTGLRRLTDGLADDSMPSWSPDGNTIVFVRRPTMRS
jgi:TolB protein